MANYIGRRTDRKKRSIDYYDELPPALRAALQEGPQPWDCGVIAHRLARALREPNRTRAQVEAYWVALIGLWHQEAIDEAQPWQPGRRLAPKGKKPIPSPHLLAGATMQLSGRPAVAPGTVDARRRSQPLRLADAQERLF
jgi:hypothetical protein